MFINISNSKIVKMKTKTLGILSLSIFILLAVTSLSAAAESEISFCDNGERNTGDLEIRKIDIENKDGDDETWFLLNTIEIEVSLKNNGDSDLEDVIFELGLFKKNSTTNVIDDMEWISDEDEEVGVGDIKDGKSESHIFEFKIDTEIDEGDYELKVKAYPEGEEDETCIAHSDDLSDSEFGSENTKADIEISKEDDSDKAVIVDTENIPRLNAFCGQEVTIQADVYNIGDEDFEDQIDVVLFNEELGVKEEDTILGDLDSGEKVITSFNFMVPENVDEKIYTLSMRTYYDYDEDDEQYDEISDENFEIELKIEGNCIYATPQTTSVSGNLESGGESGEKLVVKAIITNTGTKSVEYAISLSGYSKWASSSSLDPLTLKLGPDELREITAEFDVKEDAEGKNSFKLRVISSGKIIKEQSFEITIKKKPTALDNLALELGLPGGNYVIWIIVGINVFFLFMIILTSRRR